MTAASVVGLWWYFWYLLDGVGKNHHRPTTEPEMPAGMVKQCHQTEMQEQLKCHPSSCQHPHPNHSNTSCEHILQPGEGEPEPCTPQSAASLQHAFSILMLIKHKTTGP